MSYGVAKFPKTAGFHQIEVSTWSPYGDWKFGSLQFFLGNQPQIASQGSQKGTIPYDIVNNDPSRSKSLGRTNGKIILELEVNRSNPL